MRNSKGYSLLEVIISIAIIAVLVPSLFAMYMSGFGWVDESSGRDKEALNFQSNYDNAFSGKSFTMITKSASTSTINLFGHDIGYYELKPNSSAKVYHLSDDLLAYMYKTGGAGGSGTPYTINVTADGIVPSFSEAIQTYTVPKNTTVSFTVTGGTVTPTSKKLTPGSTQTFMVETDSGNTLSYTFTGLN